MEIAFHFMLTIGGWWLLFFLRKRAPRLQHLSVIWVAVIGHLIASAFLGLMLLAGGGWPEIEGPVQRLEAVLLFENLAAILAICGNVMCAERVHR